MKNKNIKGFTLILSLVLLIAMSLMGGTLVVLSSSDHRDNNISKLFTLLKLDCLRLKNTC